MPFFTEGLPVVTFPAPKDDEGIVAVGGELSPEILVSAYGQGVFPWFGDDSPILWWNPHPRFVLFPEKLHSSHRLERRIRSGEYRVTMDRAFDQVIRSCSEVPRPGQEGTWITEEMITAYQRLHSLGYAHSFESWFEGQLVGGLYGVSVGALFCGESMFALRRDASKVAFVTAVRFLVRQNYRLIDCQVYTEHLASFGAEEISREHFLSLLSRYRDMETETIP
ncbi:leucyl/phenylalanyl-tRNA--protein transferase [Sediminispirochaeta smaragdinae]|uniref:Leucyl/phenylalanyl-tRNA--protein transferase n=1 Tax=Sediminispirochaeta smaragdinae (strain DSM 11293 / JCM 15392 / SEBR 4228) TaxID=573413 RepID=E1R5D6_SEDSS|nr:leucyl/phenylalanyl-tRNA--protein transferase [Sediminispirochaeta smaragdinae]ADK82264.1 leucyl/phenylalanyl-tRNA/protein transferase [Sediminispirochaeta smaragdinae DSM 11293]